MSKVLRFAIIVVMLGGAAFAGWSFLLREQPAVDTGAAAAVSTVAAEQGAVRVTVEGRATVEAVRTMTVRSGISGVVTVIPEVGTHFAAGQIMVSFDATDFEKAIRQAELGLAQAALTRERSETAVSQAASDLDRTTQLAESGAATRDQVEQATLAVRYAEFALRGADLAVEQSELSLETAVAGFERSVIRAPFSGVVIGRSAGIGDIVTSSAALVVLADLSSVRVSADIDEFDIGKVAIGMRTTVSADALGAETRSSVVDRISPVAVVVNNIPIFSVSTVIENTDGRLRPGMNADLAVMISSDRGLLVPSRAVSTVRGRSYVDISVDGVIESRRVETGGDDGINIVVSEGLAEGDLVVVPSAPVFSLSTTLTTPATTGTSIIPISVPGSGGGGGGGSR